MIKFCEARIDEGSAPTFLGPEGLIALMHDKLVRYATFKTYGEIVALAGDALLLLLVVGKQQGDGAEGAKKVQQTPSSAASEQASADGPMSCAVCGSAGPLEAETLQWAMPVCAECYAANDRDLLFSQIGSFPNEGIQD